MEKLLIFVKHNFHFIWRIIEWINGELFSIFYSSEMKESLSAVLNQISTSQYFYRSILISDLHNLETLINSQAKDDLKYFNPHGFDLKSIERQFKNPAFLMMGVFEGQKNIGYFFLRFFINKKCFVGRLIDKNYRGKGIGRVMNEIMYETAWKMGFRCLSTISKKNEMVMKSHAGNPYMKILKELKNDYLLVEFIRNAQSSGHRAQGDVNQYSVTGIQ